MAKLTSLSKERLINIHLSLQEESDRLYEYVAKVEADRDRLEHVIEKIMPLITTIFAAIINIRKVIQIIRNYRG